VLSERNYLAGDLPEYKEKIHQLNLDNTQFSKLYSEYVTIDEAIYRVREGIDTAPDEYIEMLKEQRAMLKDELSDMLKRLERSRVSG